jgi:hypothetical protein
MSVESARASYLVDLVGKYAGVDSSILEIGSRKGDNLAALGRAGFRDLYGVESDAVKVGIFRESCPDVAGFVQVMEGPVRQLLGDMGDGDFDLVFTVGFLFDRTGDHSWLFGEMARLSSHSVISIEDERSGSLREIFEGHGLVEVENMDLGDLEDLHSVFHARAFEKRG